MLNLQFVSNMKISIDTESNRMILSWLFPAKLFFGDII